MEDKNQSFFGDINTRLLTIAGGLISFYALLPMFIDRLIAIFPQNFGFAYSTALIIYFVSPLIIYTFFCIVNNLTLLSFFNRFQFISSLLFLIIFGSLYLTSSNKFITIAGTVLIIFSILCLFFILLFTPAIFVRKETKISKPRIIEFRIITGFISIIFLAFYYTNHKQIKRTVLQFSSREQKDLFRKHQYQNEINKILGSTNEWKSVFYKEAMRILSEKPDTTLTIHAIPSEILAYFKKITHLLLEIEKSDYKSYDINIFRKFDSTESALYRQILSDSGSSNTYRAYEMNYYIHEYAKKMISSKQKETSGAWVDIIVHLQFKGLFWLNLIILLALYLWIKSVTYSKHEETLLREKKTGRVEGNQNYPEEAPEIRQSIEITEENIVNAEKHTHQIKTLIYLSLLTVIPFFKKADSNDVDVNRPFLPTIWPFSDINTLHRTQTTIYKQDPVDLGAILARLDNIDNNLKDVKKLQKEYHHETIHQMDTNTRKTQKTILNQWNPSDKN